MVRTCVYDNPRTLCRECWQDGQLLCSYNLQLLMEKESLRGMAIFFGANVGDWKEGAVWGDLEALPSELRGFIGSQCDPEEEIDVAVYITMTPAQINFSVNKSDWLQLSDIDRQSICTKQILGSIVWSWKTSNNSRG